MSQSEARQRFGSVHLYWHGPDHCWDATPGRHRIISKNQSNVDRQAQRARHHSGWREAMSEMLPGDAPVEASNAGVASGAAATSWLDRWIDIAQVVPRSQTERQPEPATATPLNYDITHITLSDLGIPTTEPAEGSEDAAPAEGAEKAE